jgi:MFS transporter, DHA1 family, multidrug resistance protein
LAWPTLKAPWPLVGIIDAVAVSLPVLIALSALAILPLNMFVPSLPNIARDLGAEFSVVNLAVAGYAVASAISHLVAGALSDRFGRKPVALAALVIFTLASLGCSLAHDVRFFLVCRLFQAAVIACYAVSLAAIRDTAGAGAAAGRIGYVSSAWAVAPMVGPTLGGVLDAAFGWRANFVAFALFGLGGLYLVAFHLRETNQHRSASIVLQLKGYGDLLGSAAFRGYALCMAFSIGALYVFLGGAPLVAAALGETSPIVLGLYMGLVPTGFMIGSYVVGHAGTRFAPNNFILAGRILTCTGLLIGCVLAAFQVPHPVAFFLPCIAVGLGNGLSMPACNAQVLSIRPGLAGTASGLASAFTVMGAGLFAYGAGLLINAENARLAVPGAMLASSMLSLAAAAFIVRKQTDKS